MWSQFVYLLSEAIRGFRGARSSSFSSIFTIGVSTSVLGVTLVLLQVFVEFTKMQTSEYSIRVFLSKEAETEERVKEFQNQLEQFSSIDSIHFIDKDAALEEFRREFDNEMVEILSFNPLPPSFILFPGKARQTAEGDKELRNELRRLKGVEEVTSYAAHLAWLDKWKLPAIFFSVFMTIIIGGGLLLIISNSIKLNLYARKNLVENMKYCGASELFITMPFLFEGLILGVAGSFFGIVTILASYFIINQFGSSALITNAWALPGLMILFTAFIGSLASFSTVRAFVYEDQ